MIEDVIKDIENKLSIKINESDIVYYTEGATESVVFSVSGKYLVKIMDNLTLRSQITFLELYKDFKYFQNVLCYDENLKYICFDFMPGDKLKYVQINAENIRNQIYEIVSSYKKFDDKFYGYIYDNEGMSWCDFINAEINYARPRLEPFNIDEKIFDKCLQVIGKYNIDKYLIHGDFGAHNFIIDNEENLNVIDPMPVVGDPLFDYYFAILSIPKLFMGISDEDILNKFDGPYEYKYCLYTIILIIRLSRSYVYDKENVPMYLERLNNIEKSEIYE